MLLGGILCLKSVSVVRNKTQEKIGGRPSPRSAPGCALFFSEPDHKLVHCLVPEI